MKIKTTIHIHYCKYAWEDRGEYEAYSCKLEDTDARFYIGEQKIVLEVPDDFDPRTQQIVALMEQKQKVMADYQKTVTEINERINKLQAIEHTA